MPSAAVAHHSEIIKSPIGRDATRSAAYTARMRAALISSLVAGSVTVIACSGDSDPTLGSAAPDAATIATDGAPADGATTTPGAEASVPDGSVPDVQLTDASLAECKTKAASNPKPACASCACDNCLPALKACEDDAACLALRNCAQAKNCCDELCVLTNCFGELNAAGGVGGASTNRATAVRDCTENAKCNCCGS